MRIVAVPMPRPFRTFVGVVVLAVALPVVAWGAPREQARPPRILLSVPAQVREGAVVTAGLRALAAPAGSRAVVEVAAAGRWRRAGAVAVRPWRLAVSFQVPAGVAFARVRALLLAGRHRLATSAVRSVRVQAATPAPRRRAAAAVGAPGTGAPSALSIQPPVAPPLEPPADEPAPYVGPMYWGAWIDGAPWKWEYVTNFQKAVDKPLSLLEFSAPFVECAPTCTEQFFPGGAFEEIRSHGAIPFFSWGSQVNPAKIEPSNYQLADLIDGSHDRYIERFAAEAAAWGHPFFLRFDWEMNGSWFLWGEGGGANGNQPGEYVEAWRHVHDIFKREGATNVSWVWCPFVNPNHSPNITADTASLYPGDEYVDWTCLDGYNWGTHEEAKQKWRTFSYLFGPTYDEIVNTVAPDKPMLVGETASDEVGGSKAQWIEEMFADLPSRFPAIRGLIWFDIVDREYDWPLSSSTSAEKAFGAGVAGERWLGNSFGSLGGGPIPPPG
jgi:Glycosyl hydrolase family 26